MVAVIRGRPLQAHHFCLGLDEGIIMVAQGGQRGGDGEGEGIARLEGDRVQGVEDTRRLS